MKLYIGNLSYNTTEVQLRDALAEFGPANDFYMPLDRETGRIRGFAFVTYNDRAVAQNAIARLNGLDLDGRALRVSEARDLPQSAQK